MKTAKTLLACPLMAVVVATASAAEGKIDAAAHNINIDAQPLVDALNGWAEQTGLQVIVPSGDSIRRPVAAVKGYLSAEAALQRLLAGSSLTFEFVNERTVVIIDETRAETLAEDQTQRRIQLMKWSDTNNAGASGAPAPQSAVASQRAPNASNGERVRDTTEEVIVTATKRAQSVLDVPISIEVISADAIDRRHLVSGEDYLRGVPGINQIDGPFNQTIVIRGIEISPDQQNYSAGTTVATYFGEVPTTNSAGISGNSGLDAKLIDVQRVEVLRGPQGTSFGNSSLGGAVRTIPVDPKLDTVEGKAAVGYSITSGEGDDNSMLQGVINIPVVAGKVALRASGYRLEDAGFYRNVAGNPITRAAAAAFGGQDEAVDQGIIGDTRVVGGRIAALLQATDDLKLTLMYMKQESETDGFPGATVPGYRQAVLKPADEHIRRGQIAGNSDSNLDIANAVLEYDLGWADVVGSYSYLEGGSEQTFSLSYYAGVFPNWPFSTEQGGDHREHVGELRLVTQLNGAWNGLVGIYAENVEDVGQYDYAWSGDPALNPFAPGERFSGFERNERELKQRAGFGELSWKPIESVTITGGARYYDYERTNDVSRTGQLFGGDSLTNRAAEATGSNYRGNVSYQPTKEAMVYVGWSQGFRLGGPQVGLPSDCDSNGDGIADGTSGITMASTQETKSDTVDSFEVGGKAAFFDNRVQVNAAVFRIDWEGLPVRLVAQCGFTYTANAGEARSEGIEFQMNAAMTDRIRVDAGFSVIDATLTQDAPTLGAEAGTRLPGSPSLNANAGIEFEFRVGDYDASVRTDAIYVGPFYGNLARQPDTRSGDYVKLDLSSRIDFGSLNVDLFIRNLTNSSDYTFRGIYDNGGDFYGQRLRPRTIGVQLGYDF